MIITEGSMTVIFGSVTNTSVFSVTIGVEEVTVIPRIFFVMADTVTVPISGNDKFPFIFRSHALSL